MVIERKRSSRKWNGISTFPQEFSFEQEHDIGARLTATHQMTAVIIDGDKILVRGRYLRDGSRWCKTCPDKNGVTLAKEDINYSPF